MLASVPRMKGAHGAEAGFAKELAVPSQREREPAARAAGRPAPTVSGVQAEEARGFEKIAERTEKPQEEIARRAVSRTREAGVKDHGVELPRREREEEEIRAKRFYRGVRLSGADVDKTRALEYVFDSGHMREMAAQSGGDRAPIVSSAENEGIRREIPEILEVRAARSANEIRPFRENTPDSGLPSDLLRQAVGVEQVFFGGTGLPHALCDHFSRIAEGL